MILRSCFFLQPFAADSQVIGGTIAKVQNSLKQRHQPHRVMKRFISLSVSTLALIAALPLAGFGQTNLENDPAYLPIDNALDLKTIRPTVNVNLPHFLLREALSALTNGAGPEANDIADLLKDIKLIRVVVIDPNGNNRAVLDQGMQALRAEAEKKWTPIVSVPEANVGVYALSDATGESIAGLAVLVYDHGNAVIVNVVGRVALDKVMKIAAQARKSPNDFLRNLQGLGLPAGLFGPTQAAPAREFEQPAVPNIIGPSALSGDEVLKKALAARGGAQALQDIHSIHAKGHIHFDTPALSGEGLNAEYFAIRPDKWRFTTDIKTATGLDLGRDDAGFDGQNGWEDDPGRTPQTLAGRSLEQSKANGELFAWHDDPSVYESVQCLGEASFAGKTCYALQVTFKSGHQRTRYYDTNTFLLAGSIFTMDQYYGSSLFKYTYGDYREFGGFKLPTRIGWQSKWSRGVAEYESIELNAVDESALQMPPHSAKEIVHRD
jgi:hypothetical protein